MIASLAILSLALAFPGLQKFSSPRAAPVVAPTQGGSAARKSTSFEQLSRAADAARTESQDDQAIQLYHQALNLQPHWKEGLWYLSTLVYEKERYAEARDLLRRLVAIDAEVGPGWALLGMSEFQTREYSRSLDHLQRAMSLGLGGRKEMAQSVFYFVAALLTRFEQYNDSMNILLTMVKSGQQPESLVEPFGLAALRMPFLPSEIPPDLRDMVRTAGQGALAVEAQRQDEAERLFGSMVATYANEPGVHFLYGAYLLDVHPEDGIREMKRELEISPFHVPARLRLAEEYVKEEHVEQALPIAEEAVKLEPKEPRTHMILGEVLVAKGDLVSGVQELESAERLAPQLVRIRWDLLRAYTAAGRSGDAKHEKEEIEKLNRPGTG